MSLKNATEFIKSKNPKNISGVIPQALDMHKMLKEASGNFDIFEGVGGNNLNDMFQHLMKFFNPLKMLNVDLLQLQNVIEKLPQLDGMLKGEFQNIAKELFGMKDIQELIKLPIEQLDQVKEIISGNPELKKLIPDLESKIDFMVEQAKKIIETNPFIKDDK